MSVKKNLKLLTEFFIEKIIIVVIGSMPNF